MEERGGEQKHGGRVSARGKTEERRRAMLNCAHRCSSAMQESRWMQTKKPNRSVLTLKVGYILRENIIVCQVGHLMS